MFNEVTLKRELCITLCPYYKPSKDEELTCKGFFVVERLIEGGRKSSFKKPDKKLDKSTEEELIQTLCTTCPFYREDCDFIQHGEHSPPCSGFIILGQLLESGILKIDDIRKNLQ